MIKPGKIIQVHPRVRIEPGPVMKKATATAQLLDNKRTAAHYQVGQKDALGKPIKLDEDMHYVDWKGGSVWKVYRFEKTEEPVNPAWLAAHDPEHFKGTLTEEEKPLVETGFMHRYIKHGEYATKEEALAKAQQLVREIQAEGNAR